MNASREHDHSMTGDHGSSARSEHVRRLVSDAPDQRTPEEIAADIERTRDRMERTLAALQRKLTPAALAGQAIKRVTSRSVPRGVGGGAGSAAARAVGALIPLVMPGPPRPNVPLQRGRRGAKPLTPGKIATALADAVMAALQAALSPMDAPPPRSPSSRDRARKRTRKAPAATRKRRSSTKSA
jgi:hypothetical protein